MSLKSVHYLVFVIFFISPKKAFTSLSMSSTKSRFTSFPICLLMWLIIGCTGDTECPLSLKMIEQHKGNLQPIDLRTVKVLIESFQETLLLQEDWTEIFPAWEQKLSQWIEQFSNSHHLTYGQLANLFHIPTHFQPKQSLIITHEGLYHFSDDQVSTKQFWQVIRSHFCRPQQTKSLISEQAHLRSLQASSNLVLVDDGMLNKIMDEINNVRARKYGLSPLVRVKEFEEELLPFLSQNKQPLNQFIMKLGYKGSFAGSHSGPSFILPALVAQSCNFCYFQTTTKIALFGNQIRGRVYQVYYALYAGQAVQANAPITAVQQRQNVESREPPFTIAIVTEEQTKPEVESQQPISTEQVSQAKNQSTMVEQTQQQAEASAEQSRQRIESLAESGKQSISSLIDLLFPNQFQLIENQTPPLLESNPEPTPPSPTPQAFPQITPNETITSKETLSTEFVGIALYHEVPDNFLQGETYTFRGKVLNIVSPTQSTPITISFQNVETGAYFACPSRIPAGLVEFQLPCDMKIAGEDYFLSVFSGMLGRASARRRNIKLSEKQNLKIQTPSAPTDISLQFIDNQLKLKWSSRHPITRLKISQGDQSISRLFSNFQNSFAFDIEEFGNFLPDRTVRIEIMEASSQTTSAYGRNTEFSQPGVLTFMAKENMFAEYRQDEIQLQEIPYIVEPGTRIEFTGRIREDTDNILLVLTPLQNFLQIELVPGALHLSPGTLFNTSFVVEESGVYIIEINNAGGRAILNRPIYAQNGYPLIPDFEGRREPITNVRAVADQQPPTLVQKRQVMLELINKLREQFNVEPVQLDDELNELAQNYAEDMVRRNFSGHINPEGEDPTDRAIKMGITTPIGENVANNPNITDAHYRLSRSNIHLRNTVRSFWTRVGLGFAQNSLGVFAVTQEFSSRDFDVDPLQASELRAIKDILVRDIIEISPTITSQNTQLSAQLAEWQNGLQTQSLMSLLRQLGYSGMRLRNLKAPFNEETPQMIKQRQFFFNDDRSQVGVSVKMVENELLQIYVVFI